VRFCTLRSFFVSFWATAVLFEDEHEELVFGTLEATVNVPQKKSQIFETRTFQDILFEFARFDAFVVSFVYKADADPGFGET